MSAGRKQPPFKTPCYCGESYDVPWNDHDWNCPWFITEGTTLKGRERPHVVQIGVPVVGPFDTYDDALRWSIQNTSGAGDVRVLPLTPPASEKTKENYDN